MNDSEHTEESLFQKCLELPPEERDTFVESSCGDDLELRKRVLKLLRSHEKAGAFFESLLDEDSAAIAGRLERIAPSEESAGDQIGRYHLLELIGEGAWGSVWLARQTEDIERKVALKILKLGMDTRDFLARFEAERQMLALMDHPNIARVLDAGATDYGRPFMVMEFVHGIPLLEYADRHKLSIRDRVEIFIKICHALHHAHQKGVIHRDIKPSNILVSVQGDEAVPKVIDFGIAKSNQFHLTDKTLFTSIHTFIGTPVYSSPEQLEFTGMDVDPRSDVYSLGVLLYEILCGKTPFDFDQLSNESMEAFRTLVWGKDPTRPSQRYAALNEEEQSTFAGKRKIAPAKVELLLKGDLDWIIMKCLEKEREDRYPTAHDLAEDLEAYLAGDSVTAAAPSTTYCIRKFVTRKRQARSVFALAGFSAILLALVLLLLLNGWYPDSTDKEGALAEIGTITDQPLVANQEDETIKVLREIVRQNSTSAEACSNLASHYYSRKQYDEAMIWYRKAHALSPENPEISNQIAELYAFLNDAEAAEWWMQRTLEIASDPLLANAVQVKIHLLRGEVDEALEYFRSYPVVNSELKPTTLDRLLEALMAAGNSEQALALCQQFYTPFLELRDSKLGQGTFKIVDDPFNESGNRVAEFYPGKNVVGGSDESLGIYAMKWGFPNRQVAYRLPESAQIGHADSADGKSTLYLKVGRPSVNGRPGKLDIVWGLEAAESDAEYPVPPYTNYSVLGRYVRQGLMEVRDGDAYAHLGESPLETDTYHELWFVVDHARNSYDLHIRGGNQWPRQTKVYTGAKYRKQTTQALDHFVLTTSLGFMSEDELKGEDPAYFDDIYMDPKRENLDTPDSDWVLIDDFEDDDVSDWLLRLRRGDRVLDVARVESAFLVARILHANGLESQADKVLDAVEVAIESTWRPDWNSNILLLARIHDFRGDQERAIDAIRTLIDSGQFGWLWRGVLEKGGFVNLLDEPQFHELFSKTEADMEVQYARIYDMDRRSEFAPIPLLPYQTNDSVQITFILITESEIVENEGHYGGIAWGDYDNDGYVDVALGQGTGDKTTLLFHNLGDGAFKQVTEGIVVTDPITPCLPTWADQDNDGDLDLFVCTFDDDVNAFYRNDGKGNFSKVTEGEWVNAPGGSDMAAWGDYNNDGLVDLYVGFDGQPNRLYRNRGDGTMEPINSEVNGMRMPSEGGAWMDYDNDGDVDLFVGNGQKLQFRNDGNEVFTWISSSEGGISRRNPGFALSFADYDNDGDFDVLHNSDYNEPCSLLYRNDGEAGFVNVTRILPSGGGGGAFGSAWGDYDNDGFQDVFITANGRNLLYHNEGDGRFTRILKAAAVAEENRSIRASWVDYDNDGDLDLFVTNYPYSNENKEPCEFYRNEGGTNNWIVMSLVGTASNRSAIGAKVRARTTIRGKEMTQLRQVGGHGDIGEDLRVHFGFGDAETIDLLRIEWPSGQMQEFRNVAANHFLTITENSSDVVSIPGPNREQASLETFEDQDPTPTLDTKSIAVLPFINMSGIDDNQYFAGGVYEEILGSLSRIEDLQIVSRTTMLHYAVSELTLQEIGQALDVDYVVEGSVRRIGNYVRVFVQLIDALNDRQVWAQSFDRELVDVFAAQREIAGEISKSIHLEIHPDFVEALPDRPTTSPLAYDLYIRSINIEKMEGETEASTLQRKELLEQAVKEDPNFVEAWTALKRLYALMARRVQVGLRRYNGEGQDSDAFIREHREKEKQALEKALALDPANPETLLASAVDHDWPKTAVGMEASGKILDQLIRQYPDYAMAWYHLGWWYLFSSPAETLKAVEAFEKALSLDPFNVRIIRVVLSRYLDLRYEDKIPILEDRLAKVLGETASRSWFDERASDRLGQLRNAFFKTGDESCIRDYERIWTETVSKLGNTIEKAWAELWLRVFNNDLERIVALASEQTDYENLDFDQLVYCLQIQVCSFGVLRNQGQQGAAEVVAWRILQILNHPKMEDWRENDWWITCLATAHFGMGEASKAHELTERLLNKRSAAFDPYGIWAIRAVSWVDYERSVELLLEELSMNPDWPYMGEIAALSFVNTLPEDPRIQEWYVRDGRFVNFLAKRLPVYAKYGDGN